MVLVIAAGAGVTMSSTYAGKQGLVSDLVPPHDLRNAIALNSTHFNLTRIIGPAIGGLLIATVGVAGRVLPECGELHRRAVEPGGDGHPAAPRDPATAASSKISRAACTT